MNPKTVEELISKFERNPKIQGHICILDDGLFDICLKRGIYGFPGQGGTSLNNLKVTAWRAISSLYNIGSDDLIFFYRTLGEHPGSQEFHGIFKISTVNGVPIRLLHPEDDRYLPLLKKKKKQSYMPFRFIFDKLSPTPISIPNDLRNRKGRRNNNLTIIKALSETDPNKPRLWGFRHPAVMNIGAARKKSIVAISHRQAIFLLELLRNGVERPVAYNFSNLDSYNFSCLPPDCVLLDSEFIGKHLYRYVDNPVIEFEAELYAYILCAIKDKQSPYHKDLIDQFYEINADSGVDFRDISENVILEALLTPHIQEEADILLCDSEEKNFLIIEAKKHPVSSEDVEQAQKYIQLVRHVFPNSENVIANIICPKDIKRGFRTKDVKVVHFEIEQMPGNMAKVNFALAR